MRRPSASVLVLALILVSSAAVTAPAADFPDQIVDKAGQVLDEMGTLQLKAIPESLLREAEGIAIVPGLLKAGFIVGGRHGEGVILLRDEAGSWTHPVFITLSGGSIGWQAGAQRTDVVLVFSRRTTVEEILKDRKFTLGADAAIAAGPIGRQAEAGTDGQLEAEIYSYSRSRGLFAGLAIEGSAVRVNHSHNAAFYGVRNITPEKILAGEFGELPESAAKLHERLGEWTPVEAVAE